MMVFFYCFKQGSLDFHFRDPITYSCKAALHLMLFLDTISDLLLKMSEVKVSSKHAKLSKFHAL